uniref:Uncharacterized protein n=1 Tax=Cacopsylla melanoneura TaxID=428564 RepID=A0A8D9F1G7_9HEMI
MTSTELSMGCKISVWFIVVFNLLFFLSLIIIVFYLTLVHCIIGVLEFSIVPLFFVNKYRVSFYVCNSRNFRCNFVVLFLRVIFVLNMPQDQSCLNNGGENTSKSLDQS